MTPNPPSRRLVAGCCRLSAITALCLGLACAPPIATAQHSSAPSHGMASGSTALLGQASGASPHGAPGISARSGARVGTRSGQRPIALNRPSSASRPQTRMGLQLGLGGRWWNDRNTIRQLSLSSDQQHRMDNIFEANRPVLTTLYTNLQHEETNLASLSRTDLHDESRVFTAIDRVSHARNDLEKENVHMLLQIRQQLGPLQLQALDNAISTAH